MVRVRVRVLACLVVTAAVLGCSSDGSSPTAADTDSIAWVWLEPTPGTIVRPGQDVLFTATVDYELRSADDGEIVMVLQDDLGHPLKPGSEQATVEVERGSGRLQISESLLIPDEGVNRVMVFVLLAGSPRDRTTAFINASFEVR
jgi:hypothetical protein